MMVSQSTSEQGGWYDYSPPLYGQHTGGVKSGWNPCQEQYGVILVLISKSGKPYSVVISVFRAELPSILSTNQNARSLAVFLSKRADCGPLPLFSLVNKRYISNSQYTKDNSLPDCPSKRALRPSDTSTASWPPAGLQHS